jgi:serine/threonine protein kinase, bacterial
MNFIKGTFLLILITLFLVTSCTNKSQHATVITLAGNGTPGLANGKGVSASFSNPMGIAVDSGGNIYVADSRNNIIRKINPDGMVTTLAGSGVAGSADGRGNSTSFFFPTALAADAAGNVYVADTHNSLIRKITPDGVVTTLAGRLPANPVYKKNDTTRFDNPYGIVVDKKGNLFVCDWDKDVIKKISLAGKVTVFAGSGERGSKDGIGTKASFYLPEGIVIDSKDNLYITDTYNNMIRKISPDGVVTTLAGKNAKGSADGKGTAASFNHPNGITIDKNGNIYVADVGNNKIRKVTPDGVVSTFAGSKIHGSSNGDIAAASFYRPYGITIDKSGNLYIADYQNNLIRKISF